MCESTPSTAPDRTNRDTGRIGEVHVAVGVIGNDSGEILIARRHDHAHQGGLWEFPGGKVEAGESVVAALTRELREELGITVERAEPLVKIRHRYPDRAVLLDVLRVTRYRDEAIGMEGQPIRWVPAECLPDYAFPKANRPIVAAARLPDRYAIVDVESASVDELFNRLVELQQGGIRLMRLRASSLSDGDYAELAERAAAFCRDKGVSLLLNGDADLVVRTGAAGVHMTSRELRWAERRPLPIDQWVCASCHDADDLRWAERVGADFVVLSPVLETPTHPGARPLGWDRFAALVEDAKQPVFALGGMAVRHLERAKASGAQGIAGIRQIVGH